jgi:membrane fusion protein (multidrug efflux system)
MRDIDRTVKFVLLGLIAVCAIGVLVSLFVPKGTKAAKGPAMGNGSGENGGKNAKPGRDGNGAGISSAITVETLLLVPSTIQKTIKINGDVTSRSEISLYADTSGKLVRYEADIGTEVVKGTVIALIDPSKPGSSYAVSPVRSTINGTIISLPYMVGETVTVSSPVAAIGVLDDLEVISYVPEKYTGVLKKGLTARISLVTYPGETFDAAVSQVSPVVDRVSRTVEIRMKIGDGRSRMKSGMFAAITLVTEEARDVLAVPKGAVRLYNGGTVVYAVDGDKMARRRPVITGLADDLSVELLSGVETGEEIIVSGSVSDGTKVRTAPRDSLK